MVRQGAAADACSGSGRRGGAARRWRRNHPRVRSRWSVLALTSAASLVLALVGSSRRVPHRAPARRPARCAVHRGAPRRLAWSARGERCDCQRDRASGLMLPLHSIRSSSPRLRGSSRRPHLRISSPRRSSVARRCTPLPVRRCSLPRSGCPRGPLMQAFETAWVALFPDSIQVEVLPGDVRVVAGQPFRIRAVVRGVRGPLTRVSPTMTVVGRERVTDRPARSERRRVRVRVRVGGSDISVHDCCGRQPLARVHRDGALSAARAADRRPLRVPIVRRPRTARREGCRRPLWPCRHARPPADSRRQAGRVRSDRAVGRNADAAAAQPPATKSSRRISC